MRLSTFTAPLATAALLAIAAGCAPQESPTGPTVSPPPAFDMIPGVGSIGFESPAYGLGPIDTQDGWTSTGAAGSGCAVYDHAVVATLGAPLSFGAQSLRISNAVTSGCFGDQTFSKPLLEEAGEAAAYVAVPTAVRHSKFIAQWDFASMVPLAEQPGLSVVVSPDKGDGGRMSWIQMTDTPGGLAVNFFDYQDAAPFGNLDTPGNGVGPEDDFVFTNLVSGLDRGVPHTIRVEMWLVDGPRNDVVQVYVDGALEHTGTSWEDYFRWNQGPGDLEQTAPVRESRVIRSLLFQTGGTAAPATAGHGFLIDNVSLESSTPTPPEPTLVAVTVTPTVPQVTTPVPANVCPGLLLYNWTGGWFTCDETDATGAVGTASMRVGPGTPPLGAGGVEFAVTETSQGPTILTQAGVGLPLSMISTLTYDTYFKTGDGTDQRPFFFLNVDYDLTDATATYQGRLVFVPTLPGCASLAPDAWQTIDLLALRALPCWFQTAGGGYPPKVGGADAVVHFPLNGAPGSLDALLGYYPDAGIHGNPLLSAVGFRVGSGWSATRSSMDKFVLGAFTGSGPTLANSITTYDFEPVPVPTYTTITTPASAASIKLVGGTTVTLGATHVSTNTLVCDPTGRTVNFFIDWGDDGVNLNNLVSDDYVGSGVTNASGYAELVVAATKLTRVGTFNVWADTPNDAFCGNSNDRNDDWLTFTASTSILYTGDTYKDAGTNATVSVTLSAVLSSQAGACYQGQTIRFVNDVDGDGVPELGETLLGTATTSASGLGTVASPLAPGVYDVIAVYDGDSECDGSLDYAALLVGGAGDASNGGGWYTLSGAGRVNFGFVAHKKVDRRTSSVTFSGQVLWINKGKHRLKGTVTGYTQITCPASAPAGAICGQVAGTGSLYEWDTLTLLWDLVASNASFTITVFDGGSSSSGKKGGTAVLKPDFFGIQFPAQAADGESPPTQLKGGNVVVR